MSRLTDFFKTGGQYEHSPMMHVQEEYPEGTNAPSAGASTDNIRDLNTVKSNDIVGATLGTGGEVTLAAGTYYIKGHAPTYGSARCHLNIIGGGVNKLLTGFSMNVTTNVNTVLLVSGKIVITSETVVTLVHYTQFGGLPLGYEGSNDPEGYASLEIWQLDAIKVSPIIHDNKLYPLPGNTYVTGDMYGLEYSYTSANSITVDAGICYDSLNTTLLTGSASQVVSIGTTINQIYNLFLCDDGLVKTDTDVEGTTLLGGTVTALRWIGFVLTNASGEIVSFSQSGNELEMLSRDNMVVGQVVVTSIATAVELDHSMCIPEGRVGLISYGAKSTVATHSAIYSTMNNSTLDSVVAGTHGTYTVSGGSAWGGSRDGDSLVYEPTRKFYRSAANSYVLIKSLTLKR